MGWPGRVPVRRSQLPEAVWYTVGTHWPVLTAVLDAMLPALRLASSWVSSKLPLLKDPPPCSHFLRQPYPATVTSVKEEAITRCLKQDAECVAVLCKASLQIKQELIFVGFGEAESPGLGGLVVLRRADPRLWTQSCRSRTVPSHLPCGGWGVAQLLLTNWNRLRSHEWWLLVPVSGR